MLLLICHVIKVLVVTNLLLDNTSVIIKAFQTK